MKVKVTVIRCILKSINDSYLGKYTEFNGYQRQLMLHVMTLILFTSMSYWIFIYVDLVALFRLYINLYIDKGKMIMSSLKSIFCILIKVCRQSRKTFLFFKVCRQSRKTFLFLFCFLLFFLLLFFLIFLYHQEHVAISPSFLNRSL